MLQQAKDHVLNICDVQNRAAQSILGGREALPGKGGDMMNDLQMNFTSVLVRDNLCPQKWEQRSAFHFPLSETSLFQL